MPGIVVESCDHRPYGPGQTDYEYDKWRQEEMEDEMKPWWFAFTPAGTLVLETGAPTKDKCIANLLRLAAHMPYGTWENFQKRGYTLDQLEIRP